MIRLRSLLFLPLLVLPLLGNACAQANELADDDDGIGTQTDAGDSGATTSRDSGPASPPKGSSSSSSGSADGGSSSGSSSGGSSSGGAACDPVQCAAAQDLGSMAGDGGSTADFGDTSVSGTQSKWVKFRVKDTFDGGSIISWSMHFSPAAGAEYEVRLYESASCGGSGKVITQDPYFEQWGDSVGVVDDHSYYVEVRQVGGGCPSAASWTLELTGDTQ